MRCTGLTVLCLLVGACSGNVTNTSPSASTLPEAPPPKPDKRQPIVAQHGNGIASVACPLTRPRKAKRFTEVTHVNLCESLGSRVAICEIDFPPDPATPEQICRTTDMHDARRDEIREECLRWNIPEGDIAQLITAVKVCDCGPGPGCRFRSCEDRLSCFRNTGLRWSRSSL